METLYADILLPLAIGPLTFAVEGPLAEQVEVGCGVEVPLGKGKVYTGIIKRLHHNRPPYKTIRSIIATVRTEPLATVEQLALWEWVAQYYLCTEGEVMRVAVPSLLKPAATTDEQFSDKVFTFAREQLLALAPTVRTEESLSERLDELQRRRRHAQYAAMMEFCSAAGDTAMLLAGAEVPRRALSASSTIITKLIQDGLLELHFRERTPQQVGAELISHTTLSEPQQQTLEGIQRNFASHSTVLLHGITGSGKTELYISLAAQELAAGRSTLFLIPELALSEQLISRLTAAFGEGLVVYHGNLTPHARTENYIRLMRSEGGNVVVGTRSAILLPIKQLGLIVVDEEHDRSYKQDNPAPRFSARDVAVWMAHNLGAKTLLGSATPSLESFQNAYTGKYGYAKIDERYGTGQLPTVTISDTLRSAKRGERKEHLNKELIDAISEALKQGRQTMLFQNRRGWSPYIECADCGWSPRCPHCNVTLTYYKSDGSLRCNLCGHTESAPKRCPSCHTAEPQPCGFGTEKIEEGVQRLFPTARVARLDGDIAAAKGRMRAVLRAFEQGEIDILVGTGMITKGFDFEGVQVVGVLNADNLLSRPDFRAEERTFQTIVQLSGRAGRKDGDGLTIVQTSQPDNVLLRQAASGDYYAMTRSQLADRQAFNYPPFVRLITISLRHSSAELVGFGASRLAKQLRRLLGAEYVTDAHAPAVGRTADQYILEIMVRIGRGQSHSEVKSLLRAAIAEFSRDKVTRSISVSINVDPQ